jgi:hypothetical protein
MTALRKTDWVLEPVTVYGGYRIMWRRWELTRDGWVDEFRPSQDPTVYATAARALDIIEAIERACGRFAYIVSG